VPLPQGSHPSRLATISQLRTKLKLKLIYDRQSVSQSVLVSGEVEVNLWPTVSQPVCPSVRRPSGTRDQFFFFLEISFRQLQLCYFVAPSLTRGRVCNLLVKLLLGLARAVTLGSNSGQRSDPRCIAQAWTAQKILFTIIPLLFCCLSHHGNQLSCDMAKVIPSNGHVCLAVP
jgi:hypothetical protein